MHKFVLLDKNTLEQQQTEEGTDYMELISRNSNSLIFPDDSNISLGVKKQIELLRDTYDTQTLNIYILSCMLSKKYISSENMIEPKVKNSLLEAAKGLAHAKLPHAIRTAFFINLQDVVIVTTKHKQFVLASTSLKDTAQELIENYEIEVPTQKKTSSSKIVSLSPLTLDEFNFGLMSTSLIKINSSGSSICAQVGNVWIKIAVIDHKKTILRTYDEMLLDFVSNIQNIAQFK